MVYIPLPPTQLTQAQQAASAKDNDAGGGWCVSSGTEGVDGCCDIFFGGWEEEGMLSPRCVSRHRQFVLSSLLSLSSSSLLSSPPASSTLDRYAAERHSALSEENVVSHRLSYPASPGLGCAASCGGVAAE